MGDPKKSRKKWEGPKHPWKKDTLQQELELVGRYGLRNKRELWIAKTILRRIRATARRLLALPTEIREREERRLITRLYNLGIVPSLEVALDDVLNLTVENILERRLQTIVYRRGLAQSIYHARQLIVHGHITIAGVRATSPGHLVKREEEEAIGFYPSSPYLEKITGEEKA